MGRSQLFYLLLLPLFLLTYCEGAKDRYVLLKNTCYDEQLSKLKSQSVYRDVHDSFADTFAVIQRMRPTKAFLAEKVDEAVFFRRDSLECLLIVLKQHSDAKLGLGSARIYKGRLLNDHWIFQESIWLSFNGYSKRFKNNSFENISEVARYVVLTNGKVDFSGCAIDEYFWFEYLDK